MDFEELLYSKIRTEIEKWDTDNVYALYFGVSTNPVDGNVPHFIIGRGVDNDIFPNEKWHLAVSASDETELTADPETAQALTDWLHKQGVENIGFEDTSEMYDEMMMYIGKGPAGSYELLQLGVKLAKRLFDEGFVEKKFGRNIPVIFDDLETTWYNIEATENANPKGLANEFLRKFSFNRKNSPAAKAFARASMAAMGLFRIVAILPLALFSAVFGLIFGGIRFPVTGGGIVKAAFAGIVCVIILMSRIRTLRHYIDKASLPRFAAITAADIILAAAALFSGNFIPDRLIPTAMVIGIVIFCLCDYKKMSSVRKEMTSEKGAEISKQFSELRRRNGEHRSDDSDNQ
ncbi:MAG: hypothetical protein ACI4XF_04745 [Oscillospiraceae bacterium]